jgi:hypothetical protein
MNRILLTLVVAGALLVPSAVLAASAGAANPHGDPSDPNGSCGQGSNNCNNGGLNQSSGCNANSSPSNPHCQAAITPPTTGTPPASTPVNTPATGSGPASAPDSQVAGTEAAKNQAGTPGAAAAAQQGNAPSELPFTGVDALWLVVIGAGLLGSGMILLRARESTDS